VTSGDEAPASIMTGKKASGPDSTVTSNESLKAASKRHCMVNEDGTKKKAKGLQKKKMVPDISKTNEKGINKKSVIDKALDEADMKKKAIGMKKKAMGMKKKAKGHGKKSLMNWLKRLLQWLTMVRNKKKM
jgi:hypothetical protein